MNHVPSRSSVLVSARSLAWLGGCALALASAAATTPLAAAQPKAPKPPPVVKACGVSAIPLVVGNEWTYEPVAAPAEYTLTDAQIKLTPVQPKKLVIKVTSIETKDGVTTVGLREDLDGKTHDTSITCTPGGARFTVAMDAFWFAGEAGKVVGIELGPLERKGQTLALGGGKITGTDWRDDITTTWKHVPTSKSAPTLNSGTLKLGRHWVVQPDEPIATKFGSWTTKKLGLETTVELTIDPAPLNPLRQPALLVNFFWYADGVGPVQVLNSYGQMYQLSAATLAK